MPIKKTNKTISNNVKKKNNIVKKKIDKPIKETNTSEDGFMITVPKVTLKNAINLVSEALPSKEYGDAKSGIFIESKDVDNKSMVYFTTNSLNVFISHGIELNNDIGSGFVIPNGNTLKKVVNGLQNMNEPIDMYFDDDKSQFVINCGDEYNSTLQHYDASGFVFPPTIEDIISNEEILLPMKYIDEAVSKIAFACSTDNSIPELTGVLIEQNKDSICLVGADGNRLAYIGIKSRVKNPNKVIVGVKYLKLLHSILKTLEVKENDIVKLYLSDDKVFFVSGYTTVGIQIFAGEYPIDGGYEQFIIDSNDCAYSMTFNTDKLQEKLGIAVLHNLNGNIPISFEVDFKSKKAKFKNSMFSVNEFSIVFDVGNINNNTKDTKLDVTFTPNYLNDVLNSINSKQIMISFVDSNGPVIVNQIGNSEYDYEYVFSLN